MVNKEIDIKGKDNLLEEFINNAYKNREKERKKIDADNLIRANTKLSDENRYLKIEIERLNNKYNKALELLIDYNLPCEVDDFMNINSEYGEIHCGVDEEQYKKCWDKFIEWKLSDKE